MSSLSQKRDCGPKSVKERGQSGNKIGGQVPFDLHHKHASAKKWDRTYASLSPGGHSQRWTSCNCRQLLCVLVERRKERNRKKNAFLIVFFFQTFSVGRFGISGFSYFLSSFQDCSPVFWGKLLRNGVVLSPNCLETERVCPRNGAAVSKGFKWVDLQPGFCLVLRSRAGRPAGPYTLVRSVV